MSKSKTIYYVAASIDGYIADREGKLTWLFPFDKAEGVKEHYERFIASVGAIAMGGGTYDFLLGMDEAWPYAGKPTWVFAHKARPRLREAGPEVRFTSDDVAVVHQRMVEAAAGKDVWLVGGGNLVAQFAAKGLLDEIHLSVIPVVLGGGVPLLPAALPGPLALREVTPFGLGVVELRYAVEGVGGEGGRARVGEG